ncbi:trypsin-like peptidase domain-containing protein [Streptomyces sp. NPDC001941]|uniref:VMAP-C domain-containing protein n=1 Tax=Streptomyces sp. NPDC001941 TaxID=3154659 RepID=UPI00331E0CFC
MGDVTPAVDRDDAVLHRAFVTVCGTGQPVGAGVLVTPRLVLTCAHVVNSALDLDRYSTSEPSRGRTLALRLPHVDRDRVLTARVAAGMWRPPRSRPAAERPVAPLPGTLPYYGDLAVLELDADAPTGAEPAPFLTHRDGHEVIAQWASGHALPTLRAMPRVSAHPWTALDVLGGQVRPGFSGGPLWDRARQAVVGLVVASHEADPTAPPSPEPSAARSGSTRSAPPAAMYAIGLTTIEAELPDLPPVDVPAGGRGHQRLLTALESLLPSRADVRECEELLAARLHRRSVGAAADVERLVGLAMGVRRGVPELLGIVHDQLCERRPHALAGQGDWAALLRVAQVVSPRERLAAGRRRNLDALLARCRDADPAELLRRVLPYAEGLPVPCDLADAMDVLEGYEAVPGQPVPPLLQAVARLAAHERAAGRDLAEDLDSWVRSAAPRLGVAPGAVERLPVDAGAVGQVPAAAGAVRELRTDAGPVGSAVGVTVPRGVAPRVQVELLPVAVGQLFTYQIWVWSDDGRHEVVLVQDTEVGSERVVEGIRQVLRTQVREDPDTAVVEFFVAPAWLRLDVDAWEFAGGLDDDGFHPGVERRVVLRSSERARETYAGWKRRTGAMAHSPRLLLDQACSEPRVARARLEVSPDSGIVVLCCGRKEQGRVLRQCIQAGVHTVLWHREDDDGQAGTALLALLDGVEHTYIPEAVRLERAKAVADPHCATHHGSRLSLLHDGPDHRPPPLAPDPWALTQPAPGPRAPAPAPDHRDTTYAGPPRSEHP